MARLITTRGRCDCDHAAGEGCSKCQRIEYDSPAARDGSAFYRIFREMGA